jgi:hypothetical protein
MVSTAWEDAPDKSTIWTWGRFATCRFWQVANLPHDFCRARQGRPSYNQKSRHANSVSTYDNIRGCLSRSIVASGEQAPQHRLHFGRRYLTQAHAKWPETVYF